VEEKIWEGDNRNSLATEKGAGKRRNGNPLQQCPFGTPRGCAPTVCRKKGKKKDWEKLCLSLGIIKSPGEKNVVGGPHEDISEI